MTEHRLRMWWHERVPSRMLSLRRLITVVSLLAGLASLAFADPFTFTTVNDPSGFQGTGALGINNVGQIVGFFIDGVTLTHGFVVNRGVFSTIDGPSGTVDTVASGINNAGQIVGSYKDVKGTQHGFLLSGGAFTTIDDPSAAAPGGTSASGINDAGQIVGTFVDARGVSHGFVDTGGGFTTIDYPSAVSTAASGINNAGMIVGSYQVGTNVDHAFLYAGGVFTTIDDPSASGPIGSEANGINTAGQIIGHFRMGNSDDAYLYSGGVFTTIQDPAGPGTYAYGINDARQIVGFYVNRAVSNGFLGTPFPSTGSIPSSTTLTSSPNFSFTNQPVTFTATVSPSDVTGGLAFFDGSTILGTALVGSGPISLSTSTLAAGSHTITAEYQGDGKYASSMSGITQTVIAPPVLTIGANDLPVPVPNGVSLGTPVVFTEGVPSSSLANPDFTLIPSATTCTGTPMGTCIVAIQFTPRFAGLRRGAFNLVDTSNNVLATYFFSGVGSSPAPAFSTPGAAEPTSIYSPAVGYPFGVAVDGAGNAFVTDSYKNQVLKISSSGTVTVVPVGVALNLPYGLALDAAGNLYIADAGNSRVLKLTSGTNTAIDLRVTGLVKPEGLAVDGAGNLFIAENQASNFPPNFPHGEIIEIVAATGKQVTVVASGGRVDNPGGLALDAAGDLFIANKGFEVLEIPASGVPISIETYPFSPAAVAVDGAGDLFVADRNGGRVAEIAPGLAGPGTGAQTTLASGLLMPNSVTVDGSGNVFVASIGQGSTSGSVIELHKAAAAQMISFGPIAPQELGTFPTLTATASSGLSVSFASKTPTVCTVSGNTVTLLVSGTCTILASQTGSAVYLPAPALAQSFSVLTAGQTLSATFPVPSGVILGTPVVFTEGVPSSTLANPDFTLASTGTTCAGNVSGMCAVSVKFTPQFAGLRRGAVKLVDSHNRVLATAYVSGVGASSQAPFVPGAPQVLQSFGAVSGVVVDGAGDVFFIAGSGVVYKIAGGKAVPVGLGTTLNSASALALDGAGNLYIADSGNYRVLELPYGSSSALALNITGPLVYPQGVTVDGAGNIFIANTRASVGVGRGTVIELAAGSHAQATVIGDGLNLPVGLAVDASGDLFVADWGNNRVLEVSTAGARLSIGTGLSNASGVAVDGVGDVFILDQNHNQVVEVPGTTSGPGTGAQTTVTTGLSQPHGIALDGHVNVFISNLGTTSSPGSLVEIPRQ